MWHRCGPSCLCSDSRLAVKIILPFKTFDCLLVLWFSNDKVTNTEKLVCVCVDVFWWKIDYCSLLCTNTGVRRLSSESWEEERGERSVCSHWLCLIHGSTTWQIFSVLDIHQHQRALDHPLNTSHMATLVLWSGAFSRRCPKKLWQRKKKRAKIQLSELSLKQNKWLEG